MNYPRREACSHCYAYFFVCCMMILVNSNNNKKKQKIGNFFITEATDYYPLSSSVIFAFSSLSFTLLRCYLHMAMIMMLMMWWRWRWWGNTIQCTITHIKPLSIYSPPNMFLQINDDERFSAVCWVALKSLNIVQHKWYCSAVIFHSIYAHFISEVFHHVCNRERKIFWATSLWNLFF